MRVHFASSSTGIPQYKKNYQLICKTIKKLGHTLTRHWLDKAIKHVEDINKHPLNWEKIFHDVTRSILAADVAVFENTISSFAIGYQLSLALERRKPVLMLFAESGNRDYRDTFASGIDSDLITIKGYELGNLSEILSDFFVQSSRGGEKVRFNFFIDRRIENYLDWASFTYKKSKSDILRELISDKMLHNDSNYRKYLKLIS